MVRQWVALALLVIATPGAAQGPQERQLPATEAYRHGPTGLAVPAALPDAPPRARVAILAPELDEFVEYKTADADQSITLYVFRRVSGTVPVWFDRAAQQILQREVYGGPTPLGAAAAFTPPGQSSASGLIQVFRVAKPPYRSTGVALLPLGDDWFVKLRYSSTTIAPEDLGAKMQAVLAAIEWPKQIAPVPAAMPIADCTTALAAKDGAKPRANTLGATLLQSALLGAIARKELKPTTVHIATYCRDTAPRPALANAGVYRADGARDGYLLALGDAGRGVSVTPDTLGALAGDTNQKSYSITLLNIGQSFVFAPRDRLPRPEQAFDIVKSERPVSSLATWGGAHDIAIDAKAVR